MNNNYLSSILSGLTFLMVGYFIHDIKTDIRELRSKIDTGIDSLRNKIDKDISSLRDKFDRWEENIVKIQADHEIRIYKVENPREK